MKLFLIKSMFKKYGVLIGKNAKIGTNVKIVHPVGVIIGDEAIIGDNVLIYQNVTIGKNNSKKSEKKDGYPKIEKNVIIYSNSTVVGPIDVGEGSIIGANSFVNKNVKAKTVIVGNPAKEISRVK
jgi:serine O-acetyltransferase